MNMDIDPNTGINGALFIMSTLSPRVKEGIELELYRETADSDGASEQFILEYAFGEFIKDLEELGLIFEINYGNYCEEMGLLFSFLRLSTFLLPNSLYGVIRSEEKVRNLIDGIISGSLGDDTTAIQTYLTELGGLDGQPPVHPELSDYLDQIYPLVNQTPIFSDYLKNIMELVRDERPAIETDAEIHSTYIKEIRHLVGRLSDAVNLFSADEAYDELCNLQDKVIQDFTAPINFIDYSYLFTIKREEIPDDLVAGYDLRQYHYKVSSPWYSDYYKVRNLEIPRIHQILIACFLYARTETQDAYKSQWAEAGGLLIDPTAEAQILSLYTE